MSAAWKKRAFNKQRAKLAKLYAKHKTNRWRGLTDANDICLACVKKVINKNPYTSLESWKNEQSRVNVTDADGNQIYTKKGKPKYKWVPDFLPHKRWKREIEFVKKNNRQFRADNME